METFGFYAHFYSSSCITIKYIHCEQSKNVSELLTAKLRVSASLASSFVVLTSFVLFCTKRNWTFLDIPSQTFWLLRCCPALQNTGDSRWVFLNKHTETNIQKVWSQSVSKPTTGTSCITSYCLLKIGLKCRNGIWDRDFIGLGVLFISMKHHESKIYSKLIDKKVIMGLFFWFPWRTSYSLIIACFSHYVPRQRQSKLQKAALSSVLWLKR